MPAQKKGDMHATAADTAITAGAAKTGAKPK